MVYTTIALNTTLLIDSYVCYIQGEHSGCHPSASCRRSWYGSGKVPLTCPRAEKQLLATLKATYIYRDANSFCRVSVVMGHTIIYTIAGRGHATPNSVHITLMHVQNDIIHIILY